MNGFENAADDYEQHRPSYPPLAIDWLVQALRIGPDSMVLDLAAGTGKLTRLLVPYAGHLVAVEPAEAMRRQLETSVPGVQAVEGTAESIPLATDSIDAAVVGQAFHWFDGATATAEIGRVLRPEARLGLIWNIRDESTEAQARLARLLRRYRGPSPTYRNSGWASAFDDSPVFGPLRTTEVPSVHRLDRRGIIGLVMSISYMPGLPPSDRDTAAAEAGAIFDDFADDDGLVSLSYNTRVYWTTVRKRD